MTFNKVAVIGLGYIGLPTAAIFASRGIEVCGVDTNFTVVETVNRGDIHIIEPDLNVVVQQAVQQGLLSAHISPQPADAFLIAVPTPFKGDNHDPDLKYIEAAAKGIASVLKRGDLVVLESTSPVGATEQLAEWLANARPDLTFPQNSGEKSDVHIAYCPERVLPGKVMMELISNDRVIGGITRVCAARAVALYEIFVEGTCFVTDARTAEMVKLTENSFRDVNIAFANELSLICDELDIDVWELIALANRHPRVNVLQPGAGVGGHCIAVDPWFIVARTPHLAKLIGMARQVNDAKPDWVLEKAETEVGRFLASHPEKTASDVTVAIYGIAFKPDIDDLRGSPALGIAISLSRALPHCNLMVVEPFVSRLPSEIDGKMHLTGAKQALDQADVHIVLTRHSQFIDLVPTLSFASHVVDTCGLMATTHKHA